MILKRFYEESLAQASFLIGCAQTGEALVLDPNRDLDQYMSAAAREGLRITGVTETHIHADYVSGSRDLAARTGATLYLSDEGGTDWKYGFAHESNVTLIRHGDAIAVGNLRLEAVRTPGHTPEHIAFVLTDRSACPEPVAIFTGDFVFAGDVGRPDLLERAANVKGTMEKGARALYRSLQEFKRLPDYLLVWPAHGAGSLCGKGLGGVPVTTVGYEKLVNWALHAGSEGEFVREVLAGQPEPPAYFKAMKRLNKVGPPPSPAFQAPPRLDGAALQTTLLRRGAVVDARPGHLSAAGPIDGAVAIPLSKSFTTWAGSLLPFGQPVWLVVSTEADAVAAARQLALIGYDEVVGWFDDDAVRAWHAVAAPSAPAPKVAAREAFRSLERGEVAVLDVRSQREYDAGHIPGALHIPLGTLEARLNELPQKPLVVHCAAGLRSAMAVSVLRKAGVTAVSDMAGGFREYEASGLPVETGPSTDRRTCAVA